MSWHLTPLTEAIAWALLHSLWQLAALAVLLATLLFLLRRHTANLRYTIAVTGLLFMLATPIATTRTLYRPATANIPPPPAALLSPSLPNLTAETPFILSSNPTPPTPEAFPSRLTFTLRPYLPHAIVAYSIGILLASIRLLLGFRQLRHLRAGALPAPALAVSRLHRLRTQFHITRSIRLLTSPHVDVPTVLGIFRPLILIPASALTGLTPDQLSALLAHELAHIRRHDTLINLLQSIIETILFYHPAIWWLSARIRHERELCADDLATTALTNRVIYAEALFAMESMRTGVTRGLAVAVNSTPLLPRIQRLLHPAHTPRTAWPLTLCVVLVAPTLAITLYLAGCVNPRPQSVSSINDRPGNSSTSMVTQIYDVRDLLIAPQNHRARQSDIFNERPTTTKPAPPDPATGAKNDQTMKSIVRAVQMLAAPGTWQDAGGTATILASDGHLEITQTPERQKAVADVIKQMRETGSVQVAVEAKLIVIDDATLASLPKLKFELATVKGTTTASGTILDDAQLAQVLKTIDASRTAVTTTAPRITLFNGYDGFLAVTNKIDYVQDYTLSKDAAGKPKADPKIATLTYGTALDVTATASADRKYVVMNLTPTMRQLEKFELVPAPNLPQEQKLFIQKPVINETTLSTKVSIPDGWTLLIGGLKLTSKYLEITPPAGLNQVKESRNLIILVKPTLIVHTSTPDPDTTPISK